MMMIRSFDHILAALLLCVFAISSSANAESDDDFRASQELRGEAVQLFQAGQLPDAMEKMEAALALRPGNTALLFNLSFLAVQMKDADRAATYASRYAALGLVLPENLQEGLKNLLSEARWQAIAQAFEASERSVGDAQILMTIPTEHRLVEGISTDGDGAWFFSTVADGKILRISEGGSYIVLFEAKTHGFGSFFGIGYHAVERALYVTYGHVDQSATSVREGESGTGLIKLDAMTGELLDHWPLPVSDARQQVADILVTDRGSVFVSDAQANRLYRLGEDGLMALNLQAAFMSLQGIAEAEDGMLLLADYGRGVWRVDPVAETLVLLNAPSGQTLLGIDGLFRAQNRIYAVQNGVNPHRIIALELQKDGNGIRGIRTVAKNLTAFDEPTLGTATDRGFALVAASQWPKFGDGGAVKDGQSYNPTPILEVVTD